jgi:hypothetical protein
LVINFLRLVLRKTPREEESTPVKSFVCKKRETEKKAMMLVLRVKQVEPLEK